MGSSLSKSKKKNRKSAPSEPSSSQKGRRARPASEPSVSQNPSQWNHQPTSARPPAVQGEESVHYSPTNNYDYNDLYQGKGGAKTNGSSSNKKSPGNSGGNNTPQQSNMNQPRTSISNGRPSFSLLRGRKSTQLPRDSDDGHQYQPIIHISAPIIEPIITTGSSNYSRDGTYSSLSTEQAPPATVYRSRPSLDANRYQQQLNGYVEPPRAPATGAYRAPVPALPPSAQVSSLPPPLSSLETAAFPLPPQSYPHSQEPQRLWRESLRNAAAFEGRRTDTGLTRTNSNSSQTSHGSQTSSASSPGGYRRKPVSGSTFASTLSPSSSNTSQSSFGMSRQHSLRTNAIHPDSPQTRPRHFLQERVDNASIISLPGSRFREGGAGYDDNVSSVEGSTVGSPLMHHQHHHHQPNQFPFPSAGNSPSLVGVNTQNNRHDSQFSSPRHSTASMSPSQRWSQSGPPMLGHQDQHDGMTLPGLLSPGRARFGGRTASSSARESVSSISTANYQWMEEQRESSEAQDVLHRDSVWSLFNSSSVSDFSGFSSSPTRSLLISPSLSPEQLALQRQEQQEQQHALLKYFFKGNYRAPVNKEDLGSVLDVGCGAGLWMKDMALEFPLTEIHGIDLVVPTRRRRPRVAAPLNSSDRKVDLHTSIHTTGSSAQSSDPSLSSSQRSSARSAATGEAPVMLDSMPSNCFFHKGDITQELPFADNTFDYCHVRLVLWGYPLNAFPELLTELVRVTKKGGWIEFVDMDPCIKKANESGMRINEWIKTGLIHSNMDPDLVKTLPRFMKEFCDATAAATAPRDLVLDPSNRKESFIVPSAPYGLDNLKASKISLPFGPWGGQVGELWQQNFTAFLRELEPMMMDATLSGLVMDQYHRQCQQELQQLCESSNQRMSFDGGVQGQLRISNVDQRLCTHKAWHHLIQQLVKDANLSSDSLSSAASSFSTPFSRGLGHAPVQNPSPMTPTSSIKEMRSYNNVYIVYAQKVDLEEMKQQQLFKHLEEEVLSPNPNHSASATFGTVATVGAGALEGAMSMEQVFEKAELQSPTTPVDDGKISLEDLKSEETEVAASNLTHETEAEAKSELSTDSIEQDEDTEPQYIQLEAESSDDEGGQEDGEDTIEILNRVSLEDLYPPSQDLTSESVVQETEVEEHVLQMLSVKDDVDDNDDDNEGDDGKEEVLLMLAPESRASAIEMDEPQQGEALKRQPANPTNAEAADEASVPAKESLPIAERVAQSEITDVVPSIEEVEKQGDGAKSVKGFAEEEMEETTVTNTTEVDGAEEVAEAEEEDEEEEEEEDDDDDECEEEDEQHTELASKRESSAVDSQGAQEDDTSRPKSLDGVLAELRKQKTLKKKSKSKKRRI